MATQGGIPSWLHMVDIGRDETNWPEKKLLLAVLFQAIRDAISGIGLAQNNYTGTSTRGISRKIQMRQCQDWFRKGDIGHLSYNFICQELFGDGWRSNAAFIAQKVIAKDTSLFTEILNESRGKCRSVNTKKKAPIKIYLA